MKNKLLDYNRNIFFILGANVSHEDWKIAYFIYLFFFHN